MPFSRVSLQSGARMPNWFPLRLVDTIKIPSVQLRLIPLITSSPSFQRNWSYSCLLEWTLFHPSVCVANATLSTAGEKWPEPAPVLAV
jgi:hypothetical protein